MSKAVVPVLLLQGSPHVGGVTDGLADIFAAQFPAGTVRRVVLREQQIAPCRGCNACAAPPHHCVLDSPADDTAAIFTAIQQAQLLVMAAPIYFYSLPGQCKCFIDRGQRLWHGRQSSASMDRPAKQAIALLAAGRPRGEQLFTGALLTIKYFLQLFDASLAEHLCLYGLDSLDDLQRRPGVLAEIGVLGRRWAESICTP